LFANGRKVEAAQALANAPRCSTTRPFYKSVDAFFKADQKSTNEDWIGERILKHRTNLRAGRSIEASGEMRPGKEGVLGAGIYFADGEEELQHKARHGINDEEPHAIVTARVNLGNCRDVGLGEREWRMICDGGFAKSQLESLGFHSVRSNFNGGWEYCVFDPARVHVLEVVERSGGTSRKRKRV